MSKMLKSPGSVGQPLISRFSDSLREAVYAGFMGISQVADAFYYAYSLPICCAACSARGPLTAAFTSRSSGPGTTATPRCGALGQCGPIARWSCLLGTVVAVSMIILAVIVPEGPLQFGRNSVLA